MDLPSQVDADGPRLARWAKFRRTMRYASSKPGCYVAADLFKKTFAVYRASREARNRYNIPVHNSAAALAAEHLNRVLKEPKEAGIDTVLFLTGIPGSGKTSTVLFAGQLPPHCHAVMRSACGS